MVDSFKGIIISALLIGICVIGMISFGINLQQDNQVNETLLSNPAINTTYSNLYGNYSSVQGMSEDQRTGFESESPTLGTDSFLFGSIIGTGKTLTSITTKILSASLVYIGVILGAHPLILGTIVSIILITLILLAWRLYKVGE